MSFIITLADGSVAAMHGGVGMNSMRASFLKEYGLSFDCRTKFKEGLARLSAERVDLVLGNHPEQNDTVGKMLRIGSGENIIDPKEWQAFLRSRERAIDGLMENDPELL